MPQNATAVIESVNVGKGGGTINFHVSGIDGTDYISALTQAVEADALPQKDQSVGVFGKVLDHPRVIEMRGNFAALVQVTVGSESGTTGGATEPTFTMRASIVEVTTQLDLDGNPIEVVYNDGTGGLNPPNGMAVAAVPISSGNAICTPGNGDECKGASVPKQEVVRVFTVTMQVADALQLRTWGQTHVAHTNAAPFAFPDDTEGWLMTDLQFGGGFQSPPYTTTMEFIAREDGWAPQAVYILPETNEPPHKLVSKFAPAATLPRVRLKNANIHQDKYNGYTVVRVQGTANFGDFNIPPIA